jgi:hypothetical protein
MTGRRVIWSIATVALAGMAVVLALLGTRGGSEAQPPSYGYTVKYVCGVFVNINLVDGTYTYTDWRTTVNVHNPTVDPVDIDKKAVPSPLEPDVGTPGTREPMSVPADGAFEIDCPEIIALLAGSSATGEAGGPVANCGDGIDNDVPPDGLIDLDDPQCFQQGFVFIRSPEEIDVVDAETAQRVADAGTPGVGHSIDVDTVKARDLPPAIAPESQAYYYSTKFVCGMADTDPAALDPLVPADYFSFIDVHNPDDDNPVTLQKKVVVSLPEGDTPVEPQYAEDVTLGPDGAFEADCTDIRQILYNIGLASAPFLEGWVVLQSPAELDVVGVYHTTEEAAIGGDGGVGLKIDKEPVQPELLTAVDWPEPEPLASFLKCYEIAGSDPEATVDLKTQFGLEAGVDVGTATRLCAPAQINGEGGLDPYFHFKCYEITGDPPGVSVNLTSMFGIELDVEVGPPHLLCEAALKEVVAPEPAPAPPGEPLPIQYKCYDITGDPAPAPPLDVLTQFGPEPGVVLGEPVALCSPAQKRYSGEEVWMGTLNLPDIKCYDIPPEVPPGYIVNLETQFGFEQGVAVGPATSLCLPVAKDVLPTPTLTPTAPTATPTLTPTAPTATPTPTETTPTPTAEAHYEWYRISHDIIDTPVPLPYVDTQFLYEDEVLPHTSESLLAPALKDGQGDLSDPHFKCYALSWMPGNEPDDPEVDVYLTTQFGSHYVHVGLAQVLCNSAQKDVIEPTPTPTVPPGPVPPPLHYKCYSITPETQLAGTVDVETQFGLEEEVEIGPASLLCAPALKNGEGDLNEPHLECFDIPVEPLDPEPEVILYDQFVPQGDYTPVFESQKLCVEAVKEFETCCQYTDPLSCDDLPPSVCEASGGESVPNSVCSVDHCVGP